MPSGILKQALSELLERLRYQLTRSLKLRVDYYEDLSATTIAMKKLALEHYGVAFIDATLWRAYAIA